MTRAAIIVGSRLKYTEICNFRGIFWLILRLIDENFSEKIGTPQKKNVFLNYIY